MFTMYLSSVVVRLAAFVSVSLLIVNPALVYVHLDYAHVALTAPSPGCLSPVTLDVDLASASWLSASTMMRSRFSMLRSITPSKFSNRRGRAKFLGRPCYGIEPPGSDSSSIINFWQMENKPCSIRKGLPAPSSRLTSTPQKRGGKTAPQPEQH